MKITTVGLDIGSHTMKVVELVRDKRTATLRAAGVSPTPPKALYSATRADQEALAVAIKKLYADARVSKYEVSLALPESKVFTRVIEVPQLSVRELTSAVQWEAEQYVPLPMEEVNLDFTILRDSKETGTPNMEVLLVAAPKALIEKYVQILEMADLTVVGIETEIIAASRAVVRSIPTVKAAMVVSVGAQTTDLAILRDGVLAFTRSIAAGGEALSRAVAQGLDFDISQAEEFKKTYGVERDKLEGKIVTAIKPVIDTLVGEIQRAKAFYEEKYKGERIETVILSGGTAKLPGFVVFIAQTLGVEAQLVNPWAGVVKDARFAGLDPEGPVFAVSVGLALR